MTELGRLYEHDKSDPIHCGVRIDGGPILVGLLKKCGIARIPMSPDDKYVKIKN